MLFYKDGKAIFTVVNPATGTTPTTTSKAQQWAENFAKTLSKSVAQPAS